MELVLAVDDNLTVLKQIGVYLAGEFRVNLAKSGEQAIAMAKVNAPDIILLDVNMPGMDGFETLKRMRAEPAIASIPVIFVTADANSQTEVAALEAGAMDYITKPFERSILLHRIRLCLNLSQYQHSLENTVRELEYSIAYSFTGLLSIKEGSKGDHVQRSSRFLNLLGEELIRTGRFPGELDAKALDMYVHAMPLHDIGKIGVSDAILLKPGPLNANEYDAVKQHTVIGADVLRGIYERTPDQEYLKHAMTIARGHHERYDGKGYPDGLAGEAIPLCCRVASVANVYDALISDRVYRPAYSHEEAYKIIAAGRGTEFDPTVAEAFLRLGPQFEDLAREMGGM
jgi:putative two-component system response regulator